MTTVTARWAEPVGGSGDEVAVPSRRRGVVARAWRVLLRARYLLFQRHRRARPVWESVAGHRLLVLPGVFNPRLFRTGAFLAEHAAREGTGPATVVLDMGTGSGAAGVAAAAGGARVVAVDINPVAVRCARVNALLHRIEDRMRIRQGDLFGPLAPDERFDLVLFNPPFYAGTPRDEADAAWRGPDLPGRFAAGLPARLAPGGRALVALSSDADVSAWLDAFHRAGLEVRLQARRELVNELLVLYRVSRPGEGG